MKEQIVGRIEFGNNRIGHAFSIIQEEYLDGMMWKEECIRKDNEIEALRDKNARLQRVINKYGMGKHGRKKSR